MRATFFRTTVLTLALAGCQKAENKLAESTPTEPTAAAKINEKPTPDSNPKAKQPETEPPAEPNAPKQPTPDSPKKARDAENALLSELGGFGAYDNSYRRTAGAPLKIMFRGAGPTDADMEKVRAALLKSPVLVHVNLNGCEQITGAGLAHLKDVPTIRGFSFEDRGKKITGEGLSFLSTLTELEYLYLSGEGITDASLVPIGKLTKLRNLSIYSKSITKAGYSHLAGLVNLEEIHAGDISSELDDEALAHMKGMTKLQNLKLGRDKLTDAGMAHVKNFTELRELWIDAPKVTAKGIANFAPLKRLQKLTVLSGPDFTGDALAALAGLTELKELELVYTAALDKAGGTHLGKIKSLRRLRIGGVADGGLEGIAGLRELESLDMNYSRVGDDNMKYLSGLAGLQSLVIFNTRVTDAGLKHLVGLPKLKNLSASSNSGITDAGLAHIAGIPNLESVGVSECKITGSGLKDLAKLTKLKELWISGCPVTDEHAMSLKDIRSLKEVSFTGTKVSEEKALELKKARPNMRVRDIAGDDVVLNKKPVEPRPKKAVEDLTKVPANFKFTAAEFHKEHATGAAAAKKYKDKVIELSGEVDSVGRNDAGDFIMLKVENQLLGVMCVTAEEYPWTKVAKGQKIKIKGRWPELAFSAALINCAFVETGTYTGVAKSAEELAKELAADAEATVTKYDKKNMILTGEVVAKEYNSAGAVSLSLKTGTKVKVKCSFTAFDNGVAKQIKVGQKIKVFGEFTLNFGGDEAGIYFCLPMPGEGKP